MTKKGFLLLEAKLIRAYQFIHHNTNKNISAMTFIKRYGALFRFIFENVLSRKSKLFLPFHTLVNDNGEKIFVNVSLIKYIVDRGDEMKIKLQDGDELHIKGNKNYKEFLENFA